ETTQSAKIPRVNDRSLFMFLLHLSVNVGNKVRPPEIKPAAARLRSTGAGYSLLTPARSACACAPLVSVLGNLVAQATVHKVRMPRVNMRKAALRTRARRRERRRDRLFMFRLHPW